MSDLQPMTYVDADGTVTMPFGRDKAFVVCTGFSSLSPASPA
jgi:hypothetical protein